ncbi:MAG: ABC transporter ATP-binding protein/permease [Clostridiales bacterium]|jgi:ATP-binding cassette subfamily B protein|nr:ABC transporter ATP-binding protein/permease [Clostridiales bacterium]
MHAYKWYWSYVAKYKWRLLIGLLVNTVNVGLMLVNPLFAGLIVQNVIEGGQNELLPRYLLIMILVTLYRSMSRYGFSMLFESTSQKILFNLRRDVYHRLHIQSFGWFDKNRVGDIMSRMTGDLEAIRHFTAFVSYMVIEHVLLYIAAVVVMATISVPLTLAMLFTTPVLIWAALSQSKNVRPAFRNVREQFANLNSTCSENIGGNRVVKAFTKEAHEIEKFSEVNNAFFDANMKAANVRVKYFPVMETCAALLPWILLLTGGLLTICGHLELWQMVTFGGYLWMLDAPTRIFTWAVNDMQNAATSVDKVFEMMRQPVMIESPEGIPFQARNDETFGNLRKPSLRPNFKRALKRSRRLKFVSAGFRGLPFAVEFKNVSFNYTPFETSEFVLKNISFGAKRGQTIGIVGATGSGKSTLINLIARFYDACKGDVFVDGVNVKNYVLPELRKNIAYAMQDIFLYSDTVEGNIAFGVPNASMNEIYSAAKIADAHDFVSEMPDGYDTIVGERGVGLSGGQKQRISLARAIATNPQILILDDVTSAVDMETESRIQSELKNLGGDRTTFIVAHRLSSVKDADLILVLSNGEISERGTHDELMIANGYYAKLFNEQNTAV